VKKKMPGGKTVFYTGILPNSKTPDGISAIMGHEVSYTLPITMHNA
jgi:Zn-dependent protease with chaperone function